MKKVKKVVIPAAGYGTRFLPLTKVIHKELAPVLNKPIIHYLVQEAVESGIEEVILVIANRKDQIVEYFRPNEVLEKLVNTPSKKHLYDEMIKVNNLPKVTVVYQEEQKGLAHALSMAAEVVGDEPFGVILGDDIIRSNTPALLQLIEAFDKTQSSIIGVQSVEEKNIHKYGIMQPKVEDDKDNKMFEISGAVEKPELKDAPSNRAAMGRYVFTPEMMTLFKNLKQEDGNEINVVDAFEEMMKTQSIYAYSFEGTRYDLGSMEGFVKANIDYALENDDIREEILKHIKEK